jgi:hypothetical protein
MVSQNATLSYVEGVHGLDMEPENLRLSVRLRAIDGPNSGFVFNGMGVGAWRVDTVGGSWCGLC